MELTIITNREKWNEFILANAPDNFLQSWEWGTIQGQSGKKIARLFLMDNKEQVQAGILLVESRLPFGFKYYYSPRAPIFSKHLVASEKIETFKILSKKISLWGGKMGLFWRFEPLSAEVLPGAIKTVHCQPEQSLRLNLKLKEDNLLAEMHQKTRYNIRLAEKKGVEIISSTDPADCQAFVKLMNATTERDGFRGHSSAYYNLLATANSDFIKLFLAKYQGRIIAGGLFSFWGDTATYLHGASADEYRNVMSPYLLQWRVIQSAQAAGLSRYDFYGIDENKWPGVTRFKLGFGGERICYPGTFDYPLQPLTYKLYRFWRSLMRRK